MAVTYLTPPKSRRFLAADRLRDQAASCRRLASVARTQGGALSLAVIADQFDDDARRAETFVGSKVGLLGAHDTANVIDGVASGRWIAR